MTWQCGWHKWVHTPLVTMGEVLVFYSWGAQSVLGPPASPTGQCHQLMKLVAAPLPPCLRARDKLQRGGEDLSPCVSAAPQGPLVLPGLHTGWPGAEPGRRMDELLQLCWGRQLAQQGESGCETHTHPTVPVVQRSCSIASPAHHYEPEPFLLPAPCSPCTGCLVRTRSALLVAHGTPHSKPPIATGVIYLRETSEQGTED